MDNDVIIGNIHLNSNGGIKGIDEDLRMFLGWEVINELSDVSLLDIIDTRRHQYDNTSALIDDLSKRTVMMLFLRDIHGRSHLFSATPNFDDTSQKLVSLQFANADNGEETELEIALREQKQVTNEVIGTANILYIQTDQQFKILDMNHWAEHHLRTNRVDSIGRNIGELFVLPFEKQLEIRKKLVDLGHLQDMDIPLAKSLGEERLLVWNIKVFSTISSSRNDATIHFFGHDMTERRRMEEQLAQSEKLSAIGQLAAGVAHDIAKPLMSISSLVQMLDEYSDDQFIKDKYDIINSQIDYLSRTVRKLVDLSKPMTGEREWISINTVIAEALRITTFDPRMKKIKIVQKLCDQIKAIYINFDQFLQVFINILLNAADALQESAKPHISILTECHVNYLEIIIRDNGIGIPPHILPKVFEPFFTAKKVSEGTGLGLWVCHNFVSNMGGKIRIESEEFRGTTVYITLPVK